VNKSYKKKQVMRK